MSKFLTVKEFADELRIGKSKAYDLINKKEIESIRIGSLIRISKDSMLQYLKKNIQSK